MCDNGKNKKGDEEMTVSEIRKNLKSKNHMKNIPHLKTKDGKVIIDENDPKQVKWYEEFKK